MDRFREAESGFLAARTAWRKCTERGRAQSQEYVAWLKKIRQIEDAALVTDISVEREMQDLQTFCSESTGCKKLVLLDDAKRKAYKIAVNLKQALRDLERYPPEPSRMPEADGTVFYQAYLHARKQLEDAMDELHKDNPNFNKAEAMDSILKRGLD